MKSLNAKTYISIFINLRHLPLKLLKKTVKIVRKYVIFFIIICYVMSEVSLKRFYVVLFDDGLTLKL